MDVALQCIMDDAFLNVGDGGAVSRVVCEDIHNWIQIFYQVFV